MTMQETIDELTQQRDVLNQVIRLLTGEQPHNGNKIIQMPKYKRLRTRRMSPAARKRISEAQKKRWARLKKTAGSGLRRIS